MAMLIAEFDIGDEMEFMLKGRIIGYSKNKSGDCYTIQVTSGSEKAGLSTVYLSSEDLREATIDVTN